MPALHIQYTYHPRGWWLCFSCFSLCWFSPRVLLASFLYVPLFLSLSRLSLSLSPLWSRPSPTWFPSNVQPPKSPESQFSSLSWPPAEPVRPPQLLRLPPRQLAAVETGRPQPPLPQLLPERVRQPTQLISKPYCNYSNSLMCQLLVSIIRLFFLT